jgi:hypothetical protein
MRYAHGLYNTSVMLLFIYQGLSGLMIRKGRIAGKPPSVKPIKRHRKLGPVLVLLGIAGFLAGVILIYIDKGHVLEYPLHFLTGLAVTFSICITFFLSRSIKTRTSAWRGPHFFAGIITVCLYIGQAFLGLAILF